MTAGFAFTYVQESSPLKDMLREDGFQTHIGIIHLDITNKIVTTNPCSPDTFAPDWSSKRFKTTEQKLSWEKHSIHAMPSETRKGNPCCATLLSGVMHTRV